MNERENKTTPRKIKHLAMQRERTINKRGTKEKDTSLMSISPLKPGIERDNDRAGTRARDRAGSKRIVRRGDHGGRMRSPTT